MAENPRRSSSDSSSSSSSEFEFWMVGKEPSIPQPRLLTADELFVDGVLLPLHLLSFSHPNPNSTTQLPSEPEPQTSPPPPDSSTSTSSSKRWKDILKAEERKLAERMRNKGRRDSSAGNAAELNINIWPFSRSRSAGNAGNGTGNRTKVMGARRKACSAPCSRSNSHGESSKPAATATAANTTTPSSSSRGRWPPNPGRVRFNGGIQLGGTSPIWQLRRNCRPPEPEKKTHGSDGGDAKKGGGGGGVRMLSFNMNTCIRYRNQVISCSGEGKDGVDAGDRSARSVRVGSHAGLFKLSAIFSKKVL
ncbi:uncharacterized protein LOC103707877 [Phoenix dactylifera]|uniref:Uncharacterized protein LOC103707877 n=1 Tax=Phoenix dactylifera TaxID=42345 RepID=A0A8B7C398_PHODC|nr:uncharacterized protein LOC103707877 [Phoenix dactylifera]